MKVRLLKELRKKFYIEKHDDIYALYHKDVPDFYNKSVVESKDFDNILFIYHKYIKLELERYEKRNNKIK